MNTEQNEEGKIVLYTPQGLDLKPLIEGLSIKFKPKVEFIIHQVNLYHKQGGYQMNSKKHQSFFGVKGTELAEIVKRLIGAGIIELATNYRPGNTSNTYKMVQPFDIATAQKSSYHPDEVLFIKKWVLDGYVVKSAVVSAFKKPRKNPKALIASQQKEIDNLKAIIAEMGGEAKSPLSTILPAANDIPQLSMEGAFTPTAIMPVNGQLEAKHEKLDIDLPINLIPAAENVHVPQTDKMFSDDSLTEEELEFLSMFDRSVSASQCEITTVPTVEAVPTGQQEIVELSPAIIPVAMNDDEMGDLNTDNTADGESFLNGTLSIQPYEGTLCIICDDKIGCIENFEEIKSWCLRLPYNEKQRLYHSLITSTGDTVNYPLNIHKKAKFKRSETDNGIIFTFQLMEAA